MFSIENNITTKQCNFQRKNKSDNKVNCFGAFASGLATSGAIIYLRNRATQKINLKMQDIGEIPQNEINELHKATNEALKKANLNEKIKIEWLKENTSTSKPDFSKFYTEEGFENLAQSISLKRVVERGQNAFFSPKDISILNPYSGKNIILAEGNRIYMPENKLSFASFHEIGHAMNYNSSKFWKALQKCRPATIFTPSALLLYGLFTRKSKSQYGEELNSAQKTKNFLRNNAGALSFIVAIPVLAEELKATLNGKKLAKELLPDNLFKNVMKGNKIGYLTYLLSTIVTAIGVSVAIKVKDKIIEKKEQRRYI